MTIAVLVTTHLRTLACRGKQDIPRSLLDYNLHTLRSVWKICHNQVSPFEFKQKINNRCNNSIGNDI